MKGKTLKVFVLTSEELRDLKTVELSNWVGKCFIGKRQHLKLLSQFSELDSPAVYYLISDKSESPQIQLYIGEADTVSDRLKQHAVKDWWDTFVIFISKDTNLTKAHVRYLEKLSYDIALESLTSINLENRTSPPGSRLPYSDIADMEDFHQNIIFTLDNLGIIDFLKKDLEKPVISYEQGVFEIKLTSDRVDLNNKILKAKMLLTENGYRLLKGSYIEPESRVSFYTHSYYPIREKLDKGDYFKKTEFSDCLILTKDIDFTSPSAAASVVKNRATNGKSEWKLPNGTTLAEYQASM